MGIAEDAAREYVALSGPTEWIGRTLSAGMLACKQAGSLANWVAWLLACFSALLLACQVVGWFAVCAAGILD